MNNLKKIHFIQQIIFFLSNAKRRLVFKYDLILPIMLPYKKILANNMLLFIFNIII